MPGLGEYLVKQANKRGTVVFVDTDSRLKYYPAKIDPVLLSLINRHYYRVRDWVVTEAVTQE